MSIRSNSLPVGRDLSPELQEILRRNGMQAHTIRQGEGYQLAVQGHDSPLLTYSITAQQMRDLVDWGTNSANKKAYNTFASLVSNDFYMPRNFVHARNANGRVAMGLHGYRIGVGEYGRLPWDRRCAHMMMDPSTDVSLDGHQETKKDSTCVVSVEPCLCKEHHWCQNVLTAG